MSTVLPSEHIEATNAHHNLFVELQKAIRDLQSEGILEEDDPLLTQGFVEGETLIPEFIDVALQRMTNDEILIAGLEDHQTKITARKQRVKARIDTMRGLIQQVLLKAKIPTIETATATISSRKAPVSLGELNEADIPAQYFTPGTPKLDKKALLADLKKGDEINGAQLSEPSFTISIRRS